MSLLSIEDIATRVALHQPETYPTTEKTRQAAVAAILREGRHGTEILFIKRASKDGDPWSGDMAFPGGHKESDDRDLRHTAERETLEEIDLDLPATARFLGQLDQVRANPRIEMVVSPFLYVMERPVPELTFSHEVANVHWGFLPEMHAGSTLTERVFPSFDKRQPFPGFGVDGEIVWGLTFRMLQAFLSVIDPAYEPPGG